MGLSIPYPRLSSWPGDSVQRSLRSSSSGGMRTSWSAWAISTIPPTSPSQSRPVLRRCGVGWPIRCLEPMKSQSRRTSPSQPQRTGLTATSGTSFCAIRLSGSTTPLSPSTSMAEAGPYPEPALSVGFMLPLTTTPKNISGGKNAPAAIFYLPSDALFCYNGENPIRKRE